MQRLKLNNKSNNILNINDSIILDIDDDILEEMNQLTSNNKQNIVVKKKLIIKPKKVNITNFELIEKLRNYRTIMATKIIPLTLNLPMSKTRR